MIYGLLAEPSCFCATGAKSHKEWSSPLILNRTVQCASSLNWIKLVAVAVRLRNKSCSSLKLWLMGFRPHPPVSVEVQSQARSGRALIPDNLNCQLPGERCIWFIEESLKCLDLINLTQADNTQHQKLQFAQIMIYELCRTCLSVCYCASGLALMRDAFSLSQKVWNTMCNTQYTKYCVLCIQNCRLPKLWCKSSCFSACHFTGALMQSHARSGHETRQSEFLILCRAEWRL